jgi:plastocyanin
MAPMRPVLFVALVVLAGCTAGAPPAGGSAGAPGAAVTTIDVSLTSFASAATPYGQGGGFAPLATTVTVGTLIQFVNTDSFAHTATSLVGATSFPADPGFGASALTQSGARLSSGWTSGTLAASGSSQVLLADQRGTYLYGCFFHYGSPMRGAIVVQ